ncbi:MAG: TIGR01777 family oxidoreductase [bacterium]|uniref:TIGR01777 family oxidoreductase n=1 Tax=Candidatus Methylomirabilis tolerans TaxID=3123416 RepID=A0AAJ1EIJ6_9BACT|nr:TIGR01777 family oxidoreductase [Candidatus Methylomirabilis sp.]
MTQLHVLITGSTGFVGSALVPFLATGGHRVTRLVRATPEHGIAEVQWDPEAGIIDTARLEGLDAVVHLAGENIAAGRWTAEKKVKIRDSRVGGTRLLCDSLAGLKQPPKVLVCASAIGYYGDRGDEVLTEESTLGSGFLAEVCREWEAAAKSAVQKGIRVVHLRFGMVASATGGALAKLLPPFKMGLGGVLGTGNQYISWIALDDLLGVIAHALTTEALQGPVNAVTPNPVTNQEFTRTLGRILGRFTLFPIPATAAHLAFGEMADEVLLASQRVQPTRLLATGYRFRYPDLEGALRHSLGH